MAFRMTPRDGFSVGIRLFGIYAIYEGFMDLWFPLASRLWELSRSDVMRELDESRLGPGLYLIYAVGSMAFGIILLIKAERITRWAFSEPSPPEDEDVAESASGSNVAE